MAAAARRNERKPKSLSDVFNQFARDTIAHFPEAKGRLLIHDTNESTTYGRERLARQSRRSQASVDAFLKKRTQDKNRQTYAETDNRLRLLFIMYDEPVNENEIGALPKKAEKDILFVLDHELAHLVVKDPPLAGENEQYKSSIREAVADAYALIRHYQRFGTGTECVDRYVSPFARADGLIFGGDATHFTAFTLQAISAARNALNIHELDEESTARIARNFALRHTPQPETIAKLAEKFRPVKKAWERDRDAGLRMLIEVTLDPSNDADIFRTGETWLRAFLHGVVFKDGKTPALDPWEKKTLARNLDERAFHFSRATKAARKPVPHAVWRSLGLNG